VNPVDAKYIIGDKLPETWMGFSSRRISGHTPGFDFSGTVVLAPPDCGYEVGDEVFGLAADPTTIFKSWMQGSFAEYCCPPLNQICKKPSTLSHAQAAALPLVGTTCVQAFQEHGFKAGQRVLIIGASGGVGHVATQVASLQGGTVVGVCSGSNTPFVEQCGASVVLDYGEGDIFEKIKAEVR
jgi:NADPH:quinone reductase-like Zn-dependent oxidoreductase